MHLAILQKLTIHPLIIIELATKNHNLFSTHSRKLCIWYLIDNWSDKSLFDWGNFPQCFKNSKVILIHRGGDDTILENYRQIYLLPIYSKILEIVIARQTFDYFQAFDLFCSEQNRDNVHKPGKSIRLLDRHDSYGFLKLIFR